jgi:hypothetical protein
VTVLSDPSILDVRGKFRLEVIYVLSGGPTQRITIAGSDGSDGAYDPVVGMTIDISGPLWRCQSLCVIRDTVTGLRLVVDYTVRISSGLVMEVQGLDGMPIVGQPPPPLYIKWTLTSTDPATALPPIRGSRPEFSIGEQAGVVVGVPAAEAAAGTPLVKLP